MDDIDFYCTPFFFQLELSENITIVREVLCLVDLVIPNELEYHNE